MIKKNHFIRKWEKCYFYFETRREKITLFSYEQHLYDWELILEKLGKFIYESGVENCKFWHNFAKKLSKNGRNGRRDGDAQYDKNGYSIFFEINILNDSVFWCKLIIFPDELYRVGFRCSSSKGVWEIWHRQEWYPR